MNSESPVPKSDKPAPFFRKILTMCRKLTISLLALVVVSAVAMSGRYLLAERAKSLAVKPVAAPPVTVRIHELAPEVVESAVTYSGAVKECEKAEISFRVGGTIEKMYRLAGPDGKLHAVHEGDTVSSETALAELDQADFQRERDSATEKLATAEARSAQLESEASLALLEFRRIEQLFKRNSVSVSELDTARTKQVSSSLAATAARRDIESGKIALAQANANLSYCMLRSPFKRGTIAARFVDFGQRVTANQKAFLILDLSSVVVAFGVPDTLVGHLQIGQKVDVYSDAIPGQRFQSVIHKINSAADPQTRTYEVEVRIDEPKGLRPGMIATVEFRREVRANLLPVTAIVPTSPGGSYSVYRIGEEKGRKVVQTVPVHFDDVLDNRVSVKLDANSALKTGDRVVTTGTHRLHDGQAVQVEE
jgi:RND family efflux transporter MFP subunit